MSWAVGYDERWKRDIGYGVPATCDSPGCSAPIDRGLAYVCGGEPYGGDHGCGLYFCMEHGGGQRECSHAFADAADYKPSPDTEQWNNWKLTDESWAGWRAENPEWVAQHE